MNKKKKGIDAERELIHLFWKSGWAAHRIAGSGSSRYPSPDIIAGNALRRAAVECKITKESSKYFSQEEIISLQSFAQQFGAEAWIAIKFPKKEWFFMNLEDMKESGKMKMIDIALAEMKGLNLSQFLEMKAF